MRVLLQRVTRAHVTVDDEVVGKIGPGWCAFVGIHTDDTREHAVELARKVWELRALADATGAMNRSMADDGSGEILVISQFTLYGDTAKGRRPSWSRAAKGEIAEPLVSAFSAELVRVGATVATGVFGADMKVELVNDGPVTLMLERR